jgi:septal ring factor EnvC (AmiA/AmiB activator)
MKVLISRIAFLKVMKEFLSNKLHRLIMSKYVLSLLFLCIASPMWSQLTQEQLEERKLKIQKEIQENQELLKSVRSKEKTVVGQLLIQKEKIGLKEKLIRTTERQTKLLSDDIYTNQLKINQLNRDLADLREDYAEMIRKSYKSRSEQSRAMFLLSSENFLQAYKRAQYMKQYASYRKMQGDEIKEKSQELIAYNEKISVQKKEKEKLIQENEKEKQELEKEKQEQEKLAKQIQKEKGKISAEIKKKIRDAIAAANRKAAAEKAKSNPKTSAAEKAAIEKSDKIVLTPEGKIISDNFKANRGRLPWPVEKGVVSLGYGNQPHPVFKSLQVHNSGIEITTESGASARAVFAGEVTQVQLITPVKRAVVVKHGDFFTVYQNLSSVSVQPGDKVSAKQAIGKIRTDGDGRTILKFVVSQNSTYFNPTTWLAPR